MLGAALEAALLLATSIHEDNLRAAGQWPKGKKLLRLDLGGLLEIAADAGWLPRSGVSSDAADFPQRAQLGDVVRYVQELRNLVDPGALLRETPGEFTGLDESHFQRSYRVLDAAFNRIAEVM